jgi:hypothetical protein
MLPVSPRDLCIDVEAVRALLLIHTVAHQAAIRCCLLRSPNRLRFQQTLVAFLADLGIFFSYGVPAV